MARVLRCVVCDSGWHVSDHRNTLGDALVYSDDLPDLSDCSGAGAIRSEWLAVLDVAVVDDCFGVCASRLTVSKCDPLLIGLSAWYGVQPLQETGQRLSEPADDSGDDRRVDGDVGCGRDAVHGRDDDVSELSSKAVAVTFLYRHSVSAQRVSDVELCEWSC